MQQRGQSGRKYQYTYDLGLVYEQCFEKLHRNEVGIIYTPFELLMLIIICNLNYSLSKSV